MPSSVQLMTDQEEHLTENDYLVSIDSDGSLLNVNTNEAEEWLKLKCGPFISLRYELFSVTARCFVMSCGPAFSRSEKNIFHPWG